jgi:hypothetical protein
MFLKIIFIILASIYVGTSIFIYVNCWCKNTKSLKDIDSGYLTFSILMDIIGTILSLCWPIIFIAIRIERTIRKIKK